MELDPRDGLGYALGWISAACAVLASLYPLFRRLGNALLSVPVWMRFHVGLGLMALGCGAAHAGRLGEGNARVTLLMMLVVSASGAVGRYLKPLGHWPVALWHALHLPMVFVMFACLIAHVVGSFVY